jgi:hypothetical protein
MVLRAYAAVITAMAAVSCSPRADDLPTVKTVASLATPCPDEPRAVVSLDSRSVHTPDIAECVETAWASQCTGKMSFDCDVDATGRITAVRFEGDATPELQACVRQVLQRALVLNPLQCANGDEVSAVGGGISWPSDGGTYVRFAGESGIIPAIRECAPVSTRGPTRR